MKHMLLDQEDPAFDGPGGTNRVVCYLCFLEDNGNNLNTKALYKNRLRQIEEAHGCNKWGDISWEQFVRFGKRSWERRKEALEDCYRRKDFTNPKEWLQNIEELEPSMKGASSTQKRKFILKNTVTLAELWETGYNKLTDAKKEAIQQVFERDMQRRKMAEDPSWMPRPADFLNYFGFTNLTDHLSTIVTGIDEHYHCRHPHCGCITSNSTWLSTVAAGGGQFFCPDPNLDCMRQYRANPEMYGGEKLMESKKVMVFRDPPPMRTT